MSQQRITGEKEGVRRFSALLHVKVEREWVLMKVNQMETTRLVLPELPLA
jgi:hypothetical protein